MRVDILLDNMYFRYTTKEDTLSFRDMLLEDQFAFCKLGLRGGALMVSESDTWTISLVAVEPLIGYIQGEFYSSSSVFKVNMLYVVKGYRRMKVATNLLNKIESLAIKSYPLTMFSVSTIENKPMERFLIKNGYKQSGTVKENNFYDGKLYSLTNWTKKI